MNRTSNQADQEINVGDGAIERIKKAEDNLQLDPSVRDIVLVLGDTGAGKTTTVKFITGCNLTAEKVGFCYDLKDLDGKIKNSMESETLYPEMYVDQESGAVYYDLPGFNDTRSPSIQLANAWATRLVASHACNGGGVKIAIVSNFSSLTPSENRTEFKNLLNLVCEFLIIPKKFKQSIALIASKVNNDVPEEEIVPSIAKFLTQARQDIRKVLKSKPDILERSSELIEILLTRTGGVYTKIGFFKRPIEDGPLSQQEGFDDQKLQLQYIVEECLKPTEPSEDDFGISVSPEARLYIGEIVTKFGDHLSIVMTKIGTDIEDSVQTADQQTSLTKLLENVKKIRNAILKLKKSCSREEFVQILMDDLGDVAAVSQHMNQLKELNKKIDFFAEIAEDVVYPQIHKWTDPLSKAVVRMEKQVFELTDKLNNDTDRTLSQILDSAATSFKGKIEASSTADYETQKPVFEQAKKDTEAAKSMKVRVARSLSYNSFVENINNGLRSLSFEAPGRVEEMGQDVSLELLPQLKLDSWMTKVSDFVNEVSSTLADFNLQLQNLLSQNKHKGMEEEMHKLKEDLLKLEQDNGIRLKNLADELDESKQASLDHQQKLGDLQKENQALRDNQNADLRQIELEIQENKRAEKQAIVESVTSLTAACINGVLKSQKYDNDYKKHKNNLKAELMLQGVRSSEGYRNFRENRKS